MCSYCCRYVFPCYNYTVSGLSTPLFMAIPIVYIWAGAFPALLTVRSTFNRLLLFAETYLSAALPVVRARQTGLLYCRRNASQGLRS